MSLDYLPKRLPWAEPVKQAAKAALDADLADALDEVQERAMARGYDLVPLPPPRQVRLVTVRDYDAIVEWPTITVETEGLTPRWQGEQVVMGVMTLGLGFDLWLQGEPGQLDLMLDRYAAALWLVLINNDPLGGGELDPTSLRIEPDPEGGTDQRRVVHVGVDVFLRT